ncbi:hypothetical protein LguiA_033374 [Lonicera macranthoides]
MNFVEALINSFRSPEKLLKFLDLSKLLSNTWVLLDPTNFLWAKGPEGAPVLLSSDKIGEVVRAILSDFWKSVAYEMSTIFGVRGTIHFLTKYVIDFVNLMWVRSRAVDQKLKEAEIKLRSRLHGSEESRPPQGVDSMNSKESATSSWRDFLYILFFSFFPQLNQPS